jgi:hypothetical protein
MLQNRAVQADSSLLALSVAARTISGAEKGAAGDKN